MRTMMRSLMVGALAAAMAGSAMAQVGSGLIDPNVAAESTLSALPHLTPPIVKDIVSKRPLVGIAELDTLLGSHGLTANQKRELYGRAFIHVNLDTGTRSEILMIPGAGRRMAHEFDEYRPWKSWAHFDKEISKYVGQAETDRLKRYVFIPIDLNTATDADILTIPGADSTTVRGLRRGRPWKTKEQFEKTMGARLTPREVARLSRYLVIR